MVIFVLTKVGFSDVSALAKEGNIPLWLNQGVLTQTEIDALRAIGLDVTDFTYKIDPKNEVQISEAIHTISEHHPGERIWVEFQSEN
jgi:hypothetical protein